MTTQDSFFRMRGGDAYFQRNFAGQQEPRVIPKFHDAVVACAARKGKSGNLAVLGGASGVEALALSSDLPGWTFSNVDISGDAIRFGRKNYSSFRHFETSIADPALPGILGTQDIVVAMGVLLWVGREDLQQTALNIHSVLPLGGVLAIHDFFPPRQITNEIFHHPGYFTYKEDYAHYFQASGNYKLLEKLVWEYEDNNYGWEDRLVGHSLLQKVK